MFMWQELVPLSKVRRRSETDHMHQKAQKPHKMMDVNTDKVTGGGVPIPPDQGGPSDKPAAPLPAAPAGTHGDSVSDVQMGNVEGIPKVEAANEAHDDNMNVGA